MKEWTDRLSRGIIEYDRPTLEISVSSIELTVKPETVTEGEFTVRSVDGRDFRGNVHINVNAFSTDDGRVSIITPFISGREAKVIYDVDTRNVSNDTLIEGMVNIVSTGGEYTVPYSIHVVSEFVSTSVGNIRNMFHFTNFVQTDYDDALKLFLSREFKEVFLSRDLYLRTVYEGLAECENKSVALEEFLIAARKKKRINVSLSEVSRRYSNISETIKDTVVLSRDNWGYVYIEIINESDFIETDKKVITGDDLAGSNYELSYLIRADKLHGGNNYGRIIFRHGIKYMSLEITVTGKNGGKKKDTPKVSAKIKDCIIKLEKSYFEFRLHRIEMNIWAKETLKILETLKELGYSTYFSRLIQAQVCLTIGKGSDASWILESVAETLLENKSEHIEEYCYYLYIRSLQKRDIKFTREMKQKVKEYYDNGHKSWKILWILLYMDERYDSNETLKPARIKELYVAGMKSPMLYYEAAVVFNHQPAFLRVLNDFEIQVLIFMVKWKFVSAKLAVQVADVVIREKSMKMRVFKMLSEMYAVCAEKELLSAICSLLIKSGYVGKEYIYWYDLGIKNELKLAGIYENYLASVCDMHDTADADKPDADKSDADKSADIFLPDRVLKYFIYNTDFAGNRLSFLYANIILHKEKQPEVYENYRGQIEKYGIRSISAGHMDNDLAVIYKEILNPDMITAELAPRLAEILCTYRIDFNYAKNKSNIKNVIVIHRELNNPETVPVINGNAYVRIYSAEATLVFEDIYGNRYIDGIDCTITKCFEYDSYIKKCYELAPGEAGLCIYFADRYIRYGGDSKDDIEILQTMLRMEEIADSCKTVLHKEIINYYGNHYDLDLLDDYLRAVDTSNMDAELKGKVTELLIMRGNYDKAAEIIKKYGYNGIEPKYILRCVTRLIEESDFTEDELLISMASYAYGKNKYNDTVLKYLSDFYEGNVKDLLTLWEVGNDFEFESIKLEERIISQIMFTGAYCEKIGRVYESYYKKGAKSTVKKAYLIYRSYDRFVMEKVIDERVFDFIEREYANGEEINIICDLAYIKYLSDKQELSSVQIKLAEKIVKKLCDKNIMLSCYANLRKYIKLPCRAEDKTVLEYRTRPDSKVFINYIIEAGSGENRDYVNSEMKSIYPGVFTFETVVFYGENLVYYINECSQNQDIITKSENIPVSGRELGENKSRYGLLNDMMICREMGEDSTFMEDAKEYEAQKRMADSIFNIM